MLFLLLSIVCTAALVLLFKVFEKYDIPVFQAIVLNYWTAAICGFIFLPDYKQVLSGAFIAQGWLPLALLLGVMFITIFNLVSKTTTQFGVSTASVAFKLGLVFPVMMAFVFYGESFNWLKLAGILLAFVAVILSSLKEDEASGGAHKLQFALLPFAVFVGSGLCDCFTQFANKKHLMHEGIAEFSMFIFVSAGIAGTAVLVYQLVTGKTKLKLKSAAGGIALGIPNYFSFFFLLKALATLNWGSSVIFPISNLGTVAFASVAGFLAFKDKISKVNIAGLLMAGVSIIFIVLSNYR